jgi:hypothetical protein
MTAPRPAAWTALAFLELLTRAPNATFARRLLFRILNPTNEFIASKRRDVVPRRERGWVGDQSFP